MLVAAGVLGFASATSWAGATTQAHSPGALIIEGSVTEGGAPGAFRKVVDLRTGYSKMSQHMGPSQESSGYDGKPWSAGNGIVTAVDLPALVQDALSQALIDRAGWRRPVPGLTVKASEGTAADGKIVRYRPVGGSEIEILFDDKSGLVRQVTLETDNGPLVTRYEDWRAVGAFRYPFRQTQTDNTGSVSILQAETVRRVDRLDPRELVRTRPAPHGRLDGMAPVSVPFTLAGAGKSHIFVPAKVAGVDTSLIFDTGGANYLTTEAARKLALPVTGGLNLGGVGDSSTTGGYATVDRISIGSAELRDEVVMVGPSLFGGAPVLGATGYEFLAEFRTTIDYPAQTLTFARFNDPPATTGVRTPFYSDGHSIYVEATVEGHRGLFRLDTGDGGAVTIFHDFAQRYRLGADGGDLVASGGGIGGNVVSREGKLATFSFAGLSFKALPVAFSQTKAGSFAAHSLAGNLGAGVLKCFRLTFDYPAHLLIAEPRPGAPDCGRGASVSSD